MAKDVTHGCYVVQVGRNHFRCRACSFEGNLTEAIRHCVENQFTVYP